MMATRLPGARQAAPSVGRPAAVQAPRPGRAHVGRLLCRAETAYRAPSSGAAATELEALSRFSTVVPDTNLVQELDRLQQPKAATVTSAVLSGILNSASGNLREFQIAIERAMGYDQCVPLADNEKFACELDKALANVGALFAAQVEGRVSTEVDPRSAFNTEKLVARARNLAALYKEMGVERWLARIPGTWEGIQAVRQLEAEGISCHVTLVYSFVQATAAAQAGASVIQPQIGRLADWYAKHPGAVRDAKGPREDSGFASDVNPGIRLVERMWNFCAQRHPKTKVFVSGIRQKQDALLLAGVDYLVVGPKLLEQLSQQYTLDGYNDGLTSTPAFEPEIRAVLTPEAAAAAEFAPEETAEVTRQLFQDGLGQAGLELLQAGVKGLVADVDRLEPFFRKLAVGTE